MLYQERDIHVTWLILPYLEHNAYLHKIVYPGTHTGRIDGEVTEIPRMLQLCQFILENSLYIMTLAVSAHLKS
jgi:hypothetical protein